MILVFERFRLYTTSVSPCALFLGLLPFANADGRHTKMEEASEEAACGQGEEKHCYSISMMYLNEYESFNTDTIPLSGVRAPKGPG